MLRNLLLGFVALVFAVFVYLQFNDLEQYGNSDAWIWVLIYGITSIQTVWLLVRQKCLPFIQAWLGFGVGCFVFRIQDDVGNFHLERLSMLKFWHDTPSQMIQSTNETWGLILVILWTAILIFLGGKHHIE